MATEKNKGFSLVELIIVIAVMAILVAVIAPNFIKYIDKSRKSKDIYTADQIARAVDIAFVEYPEAHATFQNGTKLSLKVSATVDGVTESYYVEVIASSGTQWTNSVSNCFNGGASGLFIKDKSGTDGFYGVLNRELGLSTTEMNAAMIPAYRKAKEGTLGKKMAGFGWEELDRWRICKRNDNGAMEIWVAQPDPWGGYPVYRLWPTPDDRYTK